MLSRSIDGHPADFHMAFPWRRRRGALRKVMLALVGVLLGLTLTACANSGLDASQTEGRGIPMETPESTKSVGRPPALFPVYWLGDTGSSTRLFREYYKANLSNASESTTDPVSAAISYMLERKPDDQHYFSPWKSGKVLGVSVSPDNMITVDLSEGSFTSGLDQRTAELAVQELVYTASAAAANAGLTPPGTASSVLILVDGKAGYNAFGRIRLGKPMVRDPKAIAPIWIIDPQAKSVQYGDSVDIFVSAQSSKLLYWQIRNLAEAPAVPKGKSATDLVEVLKATNIASGEITPRPSAGGGNTATLTKKLPVGTYAILVFRGDKNSPQKAQEIDIKQFSVTDQTAGPQPSDSASSDPAPSAR